jgi:prevent-host-death family protein
MTQLTISEARKALFDLPEQLAHSSERAVTITRRGQPVLAVLPWEFYESIVETLDILGDPEMVATLRASVDDLKRGRLISNAKAQKRLGVRPLIWPSRSGGPRRRSASLRRSRTSGSGLLR